MNRRNWFGGVSSSFLLGLGGGATLGAAVTAGAMIDPDRRVSRKSYATDAEDLLIERLFQRLEIARPTYLDIGAFEPIARSNTYLLYASGGRGVLVEPNPACVARLRSVRPHDTVLMAGIGPEDQAEADYFVFPAGEQSNTFSREQAEALAAKYGAAGAYQVLKMPLIGINRVIGEHFQGRAPDLISIDTEGLDLMILRSLDFSRFRPALVCAELRCDVHKTEREIQDLMQSHDYAIGAQNYQNAIFVDQHRTMRDHI